MMNVKQYLSSGIVESYVLGIAGEQEKLEFEALLPLYPELLTAVRAFEATLEHNALQNAVQPPAKVWNAVRRRIQTGHSHTNGNHNGNGNGETYIPIVSESNNHIRVHKYWRPAFIAVFILSKIFLFLAIYYYFMYREASRERDKLQHITHIQKTLTK